MFESVLPQWLPHALRRIMLDKLACFTVNVAKRDTWPIQHFYKRMFVYSCCLAEKHNARACIENCRQNFK